MSYKNFRFPVSTPSTGAGGLTGTWRLKKPMIDTETCVYCGLCSTYCPSSSIVISSKQRKIEIMYDYCKGCGICMSVCPRKSIVMVEE